MEENTYKGELETVSKYAGLKIVGLDGWINPTPEVKGNFQAIIEELKNLIGKEVIVHLTSDKKNYAKIMPSDAIASQKDKATEPAKAEAGKDELTPEAVDLNEESTFSRLSRIKCNEKKTYKGMNYLSWADAWFELKKIHPEATQYVDQNPQTGMPYFSDKTGGFVKVSVAIGELSHTIFMPILDNTHKPVAEDDITSFHINTAIMRGTAKAIGMHGLGLYLYQGEDVPKE